MKNLKVLYLLAFLFISVCSYGQSRPAFSDIFYIPLSSYQCLDFVAAEETITVPEGKVWEITNAQVFTIYDNRILDEKTTLSLDDQIIAYNSRGAANAPRSTWIPAGKYKLSLKFEEARTPDGRFHFTAFISGVEYSVK